MYKPRLAVVVVQMRISTRIFGQGPQGYQNPPPGTVLDHTITRKRWYDFSCESTCCLSGQREKPVCEHTDMEQEHEPFQTNCNTSELACKQVFMIWFESSGAQS